MTETPIPTDEEQQANLEEFVGAHGTEGVFVLYFRQLFYRFVKQELKSATDGIDGAGEQLYFTSDGDEVLEQHRQELLEQCEIRAWDLVDTLKSDPNLGVVIEQGEIDRLDHLDDTFTQRVHERFEDWKEEGIEILERANSETGD